MRSADSFKVHALRGGFLAIVACAAVTPALAGGPLYVVPVGTTLKPAS